MKILLFGGTTEGRLLAQKLCEAGNEVTVSCATALGVEELKNIACIKICGRLEIPAMADLASAQDLVVDATHPYSTVVSANIRAACAQANVPLRRVLREIREQDNVVQVQTCRAAAELLANEEGNILIATGSKELKDFAILAPERLFPRILPTHTGLDACEAMNIPHRNIIAMQGPFSQKVNEAVLEQYKIRWMVTRNSGVAGGYDEKINAARVCGTGVILISRPEEHGVSMNELCREVEQWNR